MYRIPYIKLLVYKLGTICLLHAGLFSPLNCTTPPVETTSVPRVGTRERAPCAFAGYLFSPRESAACIQDLGIRGFWPRALPSYASSKPAPAQSLTPHTPEIGICTDNLPLVHRCNERSLRLKMLDCHHRQSDLGWRRCPIWEVAQVIVRSRGTIGRSVMLSTDGIGCTRVDG
jgi:hypothetical protein